MSVPFGVSVTVVSGQDQSGESVLAASTFLTMIYLSIYPVSRDRNVREDFLSALALFGLREDIYFFQEPDSFVKKLFASDNNTPTKGLFWLALDREGDAIARDMIHASGKSPEETVHRSMPRLNILEQTISPPPQVYVPTRVWQETVENHRRVSLNYREVKPKPARQLYMSDHALLLPEQKLYLGWLKSLYESLLSWRKIIEKIQSDVS